MSSNAEWWSSDEVRFTGVFVLRDDLIYVRAMDVVLDEQGSAHAFVARWTGSGWGRYVVPGPAAAHCALNENDRTVLTLVPDGQVHVATPSGFAWETIDPTPDGPNSLRHMTDIRPIGDAVYAAGMARMVYRRTGPGQWERADFGMRHGRAGNGVSGFRSIDGLDARTLYAVGFGGEIWHFDGQWTRIDSPTNAKLEKVRCVSPDQVFIGGANGTLLVGSKNRWTVVPHEATRGTFWGMEHFDGRLFLADSDSLYSFDGSSVDRVELDVEPYPTTSYLHTNGTLLASVGERDVVIFDGGTWTRLIP